MSTGPYISSGEAAKYLGRSARWLRRRLAEIPHYRPEGAAPLFTRQELDRYLNKFKVEPRPSSPPGESVIESIWGPSKKKPRKSVNEMRVEP